MKKENPNDPKTWEFELTINKHINKKTGGSYLYCLDIFLIGSGCFVDY